MALGLKHLAIFAPLRHQLFVASAFDDDAVVQIEDAVAEFRTNGFPERTNGEVPAALFLS